MTPQPDKAFPPFPDRFSSFNVSTTVNNPDATFTQLSSLVTQPDLSLPQHTRTTHPGGTTAETLTLIHSDGILAGWAGWIPLSSDYRAHHDALSHV